ncbi:MAG: ribokinase [Chloroflexi bacterium]|nr:ribokinase [Chloroflexota bacterium]
MKGTLPAVAVVGSFNMDLVVRTARRPAPGETVFGTEFGMFPGGKGFNQAIAAARLGVRVAMTGRVGTDYFGDEFLNALRVDGVDAHHVLCDSSTGTGVGLPVIGADGDNSIVVVPRANMALTPADVEMAAGTIASADVLLLQLEVPQAASLRAAQIARQAGTVVVLNPAPAAEVMGELIALSDVIVPNEWEARSMTGIMPDSGDACIAVCERLFALGARQVIITLGDQGAYVASPEVRVRLRPYRVSVVDTTGAGDAFCGALAYALALGQPLLAAASLANRAAALSVTVLGAYPSMPRLAAVEALSSFG